MSTAQRTDSSTPVWKALIVVMALAGLAMDLWAFTNWRRALDPAVAGELGVELAPIDGHKPRAILSF